MNTRRKTPALLSALTALFLPACEAPPGEVECDGEAVTGEITQGPTLDLVRGDLLIQGSAVHPGGLAIRRIEALGIRAANDGFNYDRWSITVPFDQLLAMSKASQTAGVEVAVSARDVCDVETELGKFVVVVDDSPEVEVQSLTLQHSIPSGETYVPATGAVPAVLTLTANPRAAGAEVALAANTGRFAGSGTPSHTVILSGDGDSDATATVLFTGDQAGIALITATAGDRVASTQLTVAGAPSLIPSAGTLIGGQTIRVTVFSDGRIVSCQATPTRGMTALTGDQDIMGLPGAEDVNDDGRIDIDIAALESLESEATVTVACIDAYGQASSGEYTGQPLPAPDPVEPPPEEPDP